MLVLLIFYDLSAWGVIRILHPQHGGSSSQPGGSKLSGSGGASSIHLDPDELRAKSARVLLRRMRAKFLLLNAIMPVIILSLTLAGILTMVTGHVPYYGALYVVMNLSFCPAFGVVVILTTRRLTHARVQTAGSVGSRRAARTRYKGP